MTSTALKLTALILMFLDHINSFIGGAPIWLKWIGRVSAPLFVFTMVWGLFYTRDRMKYLKNLYFWGIGMAVGDIAMAALVPNAFLAPTNDIFVTLFLVGYFVTMIEKFMRKETGGALILLGVFLLAQGAGALLIPLSMEFVPGIKNLFLLVIALFPNILYCEGSFLFVIVGLGLYFARKLPPLKFSLAYLLLSLFMAFSSSPLDFSYQGLFLENYQWMMIFALPLMLLYNGKKGKALKWFFYIFYPAHIFFLSWLGSVLHF